MGNHNTSLEVASGFSLVHSSRWSASPSVEEACGVVQLLAQFQALKLMGVTPANIAASFFRRCI